MTVAEAHEPLIAAEADKLLDQDAIVRDALAEVESNGIVFLDEIDKICAREGRGGADVSREGVQRDLLPLIEGTTVATKHGTIKTDHILFVASGAFHIARPSDLLPELQGRLPIRVELNSLTEDDFKRILTDTEASLIKQYVALMQTEGLDLEFTDDAVAAIARIAAKVNGSVENIGARRLQTVMERVLDEVSFTAADRSGENDPHRRRVRRAPRRRPRRQRRPEPVHSVIGFAANRSGSRHDIARSDLRRRRPAGACQRDFGECRRLRRDLAREPVSAARRQICRHCAGQRSRRTLDGA